MSHTRGDCKAAEWRKAGGDHVTEPAATDNYLNGGFLVLSPDEAVLAAIVARLATVDDLSHYPFAEQDFLNKFYRAAGAHCLRV